MTSKYEKNMKITSIFAVLKSFVHTINLEFNNVSNESAIISCSNASNKMKKKIEFLIIIMDLFVEHINFSHDAYSL